MGGRSRGYRQTVKLVLILGTIIITVFYFENFAY